MITGGGDLAVPGWGGDVAVIDVARDQLAFDTGPAYEQLWAVCPSPALQHLAIGGDGELRIVDLAGDDIVVFPADPGLHKTAWTSDSRLVVVHDGFVDSSVSTVPPTHRWPSWTDHTPGP